MEAVVHDRLCSPPPVLGQRRADLLALELRRESDDRGGPADERRAAAGDERLLVGAAAGLQLLDMAVRIHAAGQHKEPVRLDRLPPRKPLPDRSDPPARDRDIAAEPLGGGDHGPTSEDNVVLAHAQLPARWSG